MDASVLASSAFVGDGVETAPVRLSWLVTVRWTTLLAGAGAMGAGHSALHASAPAGPAVTLLAACAVSNLWLLWRIRSSPAAQNLPTIAGTLVCADVLLISWLVWRSGGVLNPASIFYLVQIVVSALVLGRAWTWVITGLAAGAYAALFLAPPAELRAAQVMHPEIAIHMRGMWLGFAGTALIIAVLVARLATAIERRDRALASLRKEAERATRVAGLATLAAGAAHELATPLSTIAVAAGELERGLLDGHGREDWQKDANLIRLEAGRCRDILDGMAAGTGGTMGEAPRATSVAEIFEAAKAHVPPGDRPRISVDVTGDTRVVWPSRVVARALGNLLHNAMQASTDGSPVHLRASIVDGFVHVSIVDQGVGMSEDTLARAGDPFFSTKPAGAGTGLGLFVARSSIEQLGGQLRLDSAVGRGTTASVRLPIDVVSRRSDADV